MNKDVGIAVIGSGYWGKNLVRNYYEMGKLRLICDRSEEVLERFQAQYPGVDGCLTLPEVLARDDIDGVVIATPAETHYRLAREALLAGKHVYVEKPLVLDEAEGADLISLAKENGLTLMVGHLLHYHPVFVRLKEMALNGELGRINYIYSHRLNLGKIRREENILWSFAPHDISMILSLAGEAPEAVQATGGNYLHKRIADVTTTHMAFPSGLQAHIFVSWLHPFKEQKLVVVGDKKMAVFDDTLSWEDKLLLYPHEIQWQQNVPVPTKADPQRVEIPQAEPLRQECEHFLWCMGNGCRPVTDAEEGLRVLRVLNAAQGGLDDERRVQSAERMAQSGRSVHERERMTDDGGHPSETPSGTPSELFHGAGKADHFVHETAVVDEGVEIGEGTKVWHFSHVLKDSRIGEGCNIGQNVVIGPEVEIGRGCKIQNNVSVYKGVTLEDGVFCGPSMVFTNIYNPRAEIGKMDQVRPTLVRHGATLGANCTVVCGVNVGAYGFVGAGAVVTRNVPDHGLMLGNPARRVGWMCACGERLTDALDCLVCGKGYEETEEGLKEIIRQDRQD